MPGPWTSYALVDEAQFRHPRRCVEIPTVDQQGSSHFQENPLGGIEYAVAGFLGFLFGFPGH